MAAAAGETHEGNDLIAIVRVFFAYQITCENAHEALF